MNILFLVIYYIKCGINILLAKIINLFKKVNEDKKIIKCNSKKLSDYLYLIKLEGTYYEMGCQYGELMKDLIKEEIEKFIKFITENQDVFFSKMNPILKKKLKKDANIMDASFQMYLNCLYFIPEEHIDFYKGMAEKAEIDYNKLVSTNFFFELMENHCIMYSHLTDKGMLSIRTLDLYSPLFNQCLTVFKPKNKNKYTSLGFSFWFGQVTAISEKYLMLGESFYDYNLGKDERKGVPFWLVFHKIMAEANSIQDAKEIMKNIKRMGNLEISVTDCKNNQAAIFKYSSSVLDQHLNLNNKNTAIYSVTPKEKSRFEKYKNNFKTAEEAIHNMLPMVKSGELHIMMYYDNYLYVSVTTEYLQSFNNDFVKLKFEDLFKDLTK